MVFLILFRKPFMFIHFSMQHCIAPWQAVLALHLGAGVSYASFANAIAAERVKVMSSTYLYPVVAPIWNQR